MEIFNDPKFLMWILTMAGLVLIKFNDLAHLSKDFRELKEDLKSLIGKIDSLFEEIEANKEKITEINVRCEEREKRFNQAIDIACKVKKTRTRRKKTSKN